MLFSTKFIRSAHSHMTQPPSGSPLLPLHIDFSSNGGQRYSLIWVELYFFHAVNLPVASTTIKQQIQVLPMTYKTPHVPTHDPPSFSRAMESHLSCLWNRPGTFLSRTWTLTVPSLEVFSLTHVHDMCLQLIWGSAQQQFLKEAFS